MPVPPPLPPAPCPMKILIAKPGLDGHDQGAKIVVRLLRDAGHDVLYTGLRASVEAIVAAARDEDVDAVGLSVLSGAHGPLLARLRAGLAEAGMPDLPVVVGGNIPPADREALLNSGAAAVLPTGTPFDTIAEAFGALGATLSGGAA